MNNDSLKSLDIDDIKDEFSQAFFEGKKPTLTEYAQRYPEFAEELTDFILSFAELTAVEPESLEPTELSERALVRGLSASKAKAKTVAARLQELGLAQAAFVNELRAPMELLALFHRTHVTSGAERFVRALARTLGLTEAQSRNMLAPRALAHRSKGAPRAKAQTFSQLVEELYSKDLMSKEDRDYWLVGETE